MPQHPNRQNPERGQTLVIFALIAVVLFAVVGLAVDGGFSYFASDRLERGAVASALAGVPDMPNFDVAPNDASSTAIAAAAKNGWSIGGANNVAIKVEPVLDKLGNQLRNQLSVTITSDVPVFFMKLLGFGSHREARTAVAEYLRPITLGQPGQKLGSTLDELGNPNQYYFMRSEGYGTDRSQGDAYGPNPSNWGGSFQSTDIHALNSVPPSSEAPAQPRTLPARGGQNYQIYLPPGQSATLEVYNPAFAPDHAASGGNGNAYNYHEDDTDFPESGAGCPNAAPLCGPTTKAQWPVMSYTLYKNLNPFDHTQDKWMSNLVVQSIDATSQSTYTIPNSLTPNTKYSTAPASSGVYHQWVDVANPVKAATAAQDARLWAAPVAKSADYADVLTGAPLTGSSYRLRIDQLDQLLGDPGAPLRTQTQESQAHKGYSVRLAPNDTGCLIIAPATSSGCTVTALDDITFYTPLNAGQLSLPVVSIPPEYAGRSFSLYIYDPGDISCNGCSNVLTVNRPAGGGAFATADTTLGVWAGGSDESGSFGAFPVVPPGLNSAFINTRNATTNIYNGKWLRFDLGVPIDYAADVAAGDSSTWFWYLNYSTGGTAGDTITANLGFSGAPVHIISG